MEGFWSVMSVTNISRPRTEKKHHDDDTTYCNMKSGVHHTFILGTTFTSCCGTGTITWCGAGINTCCCWLIPPCRPLPTPRPLTAPLPLPPLACRITPTGAWTAGACCWNCCCCVTMKFFTCGAWTCCWSFCCGCCCCTTWRITGLGSTVLRFTIVAIALPCGGSSKNWEPSPATPHRITNLNQAS